MHFLLYQHQRRISYQEVKNIQQQTWFNPTHWCKEQAFVINHFLDCEESQNHAGDPVGDDYKKMGTLFEHPEDGMWIWLDVGSALRTVWTGRRCSTAKKTRNNIEILSVILSH
ncbi:PREDICTED: uncharacterized protein C4orf32 homolog isoform X3 [Myotis brandtii]|uniref:uncharacterized protein C4orf32 homolog isoform X3 n=1 Tax=Myotis brandtii TaxID=109478 RepID=UPI0007040272|nr:PREDICTED: uncharacterized protein C4orf32 homolog isoform X3 [Myotis brandtii]